MAIATTLIMTGCGNKTPEAETDGNVAETDRTELGESCTEAPEGGEPEQFATETMNRYTPVKNQERSPLCWAYAMLATIETEHLTMGDSVNLSVKYVARCLIEESGRHYYLTGGRSGLTMRGMGQTLLNIIERRGIVPFNAYRDDKYADTRVLMNKVRRLVERNINTRGGLERLERQLGDIADETLGPAPRNVFMLGARYTPQEFARSVCAPGEYIGLTSFTHHPFYTSFVPELPDNWERNRLYNVPIDTLMARIESAVRQGHGVCWEGDISERGFSFRRGVARLDSDADTGQDARQRTFERLETTDDHCMAIVGLARDRQGRLYFVMKNSWGTDNPFGGLMYVAADYVRMKTVAVYMLRAAYRNSL